MELGSEVSAPYQPGPRHENVRRFNLTFETGERKDNGQLSVGDKIDDRGEMGINLGVAVESQFQALAVPHAHMYYNGGDWHGRIPANGNMFFDEAFGNPPRVPHSDRA